LSTKILPGNVLNAVKRVRPLYAAGRRARFALGTRLGARLVPGLEGRAHYNDFMLNSANPVDVENYRRSAVEFVELLGSSLQEAGRDWTSVSAVLEVGCGYGRIVRELRKLIPVEKIYVSDVIDEGALFTAEEFGVQRIPVVEEAGPEWSGRFDYVYLASVYSHMPKAAIADHLARTEALMAPGGVLLFTTHGPGSAGMIEKYKQYWLDEARIGAAMDTDGYFFERYPYYYEEYGMTWITRDLVEKLVAGSAPGLTAVSYHPMGAAGHQDVYVWRK
jgi:SAM-dependent methyltransferase